jgi:hypothetical protein
MSNRSVKSTKKTSFLSTFTYFIPAPPHRKSGYREREFDKIMAGILQSGFELEKLETQAVETGLYVVAVLRSRTKKIYQLDASQDLQENFKLSHSHSTPDIELDPDEEL